MIASPSFDPKNKETFELNLVREENHRKLPPFARLPHRKVI